MRYTFFILSIVLSAAAYAQNDGPGTVAFEFRQFQDSLKKLWGDTSLYFPQAKFTKVVGYTFNAGINDEGEGGDYSIYYDDKKRFAKSIDSFKVALTAQQTDTLLKILNDTNTYEWGQSGCFVPHHAFVFYNPKNKPVAYINICFMCHQTSANPQTPIMIWGGIPGEGQDRLVDFCRSIGLPINPEVKDSSR